MQSSFYNMTKLETQGNISPNPHLFSKRQISGFRISFEGFFNRHYWPLKLSDCVLNLAETSSNILNRECRHTLMILQQRNEKWPI